MKKLFTFLFLFAIVTAVVNAQYYYVPHINAGQNPGGLNNDVEQPGTTGWATIATTSTTPVWSTVATIPFSFDFNGTSFTSLMVSTSGVLTFTTTAPTVPASNNLNIPNVAIPDNSILCWGLSAQGANDQIRTKTFGTAPNRQFWIQFNSFSCPSSTGWTYWAIALEETSNKIYVVDQRSYNAPLSLTIGLQYNSTSALAVTGSPNLGSNATWYADDTPIDNSYFEFVPGQQAANEIELSSIDNSPYVIAPGSVDIKGTVTNYGSTPITSFNVKYEFNGNTYTDTKSGLNIPFAGTYSFTHATPANLPAVGNYPVKVWVELTGDANHVNDTLNQTLIGMLFVPQKKVVVEEATGTWCGWCPRGAVYMDSLHNLHPNDAMLVAVHNSDPMVVASYDAWMGTQIGGYPSGLVDRKDIDIDPTQFIASYDVHINDIAPCDVDVIANYNPSNNYAWITVSAHFAGDVNGDLRLGLILTEDDVTGTSSAYNQANYYSNTSQNLPLQGAGHNWQLEPNPVPAANMTYNHVARAIPSGINGVAGSLPPNMTANATYSYSFGYQIPATWDITQLHAIGIVVDNSNGQILNANSNTFVTGIAENASESFKIRVFPNPVTSTSGQVFVNMKKNAEVVFEVTDVLGKVVRSNTSTLNAGEYIYPLNMTGLENGIYNVRVIVGNETLTERVILNN